MVEVGSAYLVHLWAEKASSPFIPKHWEQLFQSVSSKQPSFNTLLQIQVSFGPLLLPNHARLRVGLWMLFLKCYDSLEVVLLWGRNLNFLFCVKIHFCSICHACFDLMRLDAIFLLPDAYWCCCHAWFWVLVTLAFAHIRMLMMITPCSWNFVLTKPCMNLVLFVAVWWLHDCSWPCLFMWYCWNSFFLWWWALILMLLFRNLPWLQGW